MALQDELQDYVDGTFKAGWATREGQQVPDPEAVPLNNTAVHFKLATVLYADLAGSTKMVADRSWQFASEIYKNYLYCASRLIRNQGGDIVAFDGDRVMGVFLGASQSSNAAKCALKINYAVQKIISPAQKKQYPNTSFDLKQSVGIDVSEVRVSRTGVRGDNDLVWVGRSPNYAAKLNDLAGTSPTWITGAVFDRLSEDAKLGGSPKQLMWEKRSWTPMGGMTVYCSNWWWKV